MIHHLLASCASWALCQLNSVLIELKRQRIRSDTLLGRSPETVAGRWRGTIAVHQLVIV
jgi:hypothetical protein